MNQPRVYMCSPSWTPLPPPIPTHHLDHPRAPVLSALFHASKLDRWSISHMVIYMLQCYSNFFEWQNDSQGWQILTAGSMNGSVEVWTADLRMVEPCTPDFKVLGIGCPIKQDTGLSRPGRQSRNGTKASVVCARTWTRQTMKEVKMWGTVKTWKGTEWLEVEIKKALQGLTRSQLWLQLRDGETRHPREGDQTGETSSLP